MEPRVLSLAEQAYGSDKDGLVWAYFFSDEAPGRIVDGAEAASFLALDEEQKQGGFLWLHFNVSNSASQPWLEKHLELPGAFYESLDETGGSTRLEHEDDALVAVVHDVLFNFTFDVSDIATVTLAAQRRALISVRARPLRSLDRLRAAVKLGTIFRSPAELFGQLLREQAEVLSDIVRESTSKVDRAEDKLLAKVAATSRAELGSLRRLLVRLRRLLAPEPAALFRLLNRPPRWLSGEDVQDLRQAAEEFAAVVSDSATVIERIKLLQEEVAALTNEQNNSSLFVLTIVTTAALPFNVVGALFGMNVGGIPLSEHPHGFWLIVAFVAVFTALVGYLVARRR